jgi:hypothetical protein
MVDGVPTKSAGFPVEIDRLSANGAKPLTPGLAEVNRSEPGVTDVT